MKLEEIDKLLDSIYYNLLSPVAYTSKNQVYKAAKRFNKSITKQNVKK